MSTAVRGELPLLMRNEWRLYLRSGRLSGASVGMLVLSQLLLHAIALVLVSLGRGPQTPPDTLVVMLSAGLLSMLLIMVSRSLGGAVQALYTRGDLDLLLSSPIDRRAIIGVRMGMLALSVMMELALLVWPFANVFVLFGRFAWFKAYLLVPAMAMFATSVGLAVTLLCFRTIGPRRTRVVVQVLAVLVGISMTLAFYLPQLLQQGRVPGPPMGGSMALIAHSSGTLRTVLMAPAQWVMESYLPTALFFAGAAALLMLTIDLAGEPIVRTLTTVTSGGLRRARRAAAGAVRFRRSFRVVVVLKELKLVARDPFLITQILQQSLAVLPMVFVLWRTRLGGDLPLPWLSVIWLASALSGPLSWLTIIAEDAPDLLAAAPVTRAALVRAKIEAAVLPTLPICVLPLLFLLRSRPWFAVCVCLCALGASVSNALLNMRNPVARRRDTFKTRYRGSGANGLLEVLLKLVWFAACLALAWAGRTMLGWR